MEVGVPAYYHVGARIRRLRLDASSDGAGLFDLQGDFRSISGLLLERGRELIRRLLVQGRIDNDLFRIVGKELAKGARQDEKTQQDSLHG